MVADNISADSSLTESVAPEESLSPSTTVTVSVTDTSSDTSMSFLKPSQSLVWKYFRRQARSAQCLLCKKVLSYNGGTTSNLIKHLEIKHKPEVEVHGETTTPKDTVPAKQLSIMKYGQLCKGKSVDKPCSVETQEEITHILPKWTWRDMRPISIVRDKGLIELLAFLEPNYRPPSTTHVSAQIHKDFEDGKAAVKKQLHGNTSIALTTDIWTSRSTQSFATTTAHFVDKHWNLTTCILETVHFPGHHTGILILQKIKDALAQYDVTADRVSAVVHDEAANAVLAGKLNYFVFYTVKPSCF